MSTFSTSKAIAMLLQTTVSCQVMLCELLEKDSNDDRGARYAREKLILNNTLVHCFESEDGTTAGSAEEFVPKLLPPLFKESPPDVLKSDQGTPMLLRSSSLFGNKKCDAKK